MLHRLHMLLEASPLANWFFSKNPSIYVACIAFGLGSIFLHQFLMSGSLLLTMWILARHEGWRKGQGL
jgi:hypothetical protein